MPLGLASCTTEHICHFVFSRWIMVCVGTKLALHLELLAVERWILTVYKN
jgi:hypothetical protein